MPIDVKKFVLLAISINLYIVSAAFLTIYFMMEFASSTSISLLICALFCGIGLLALYLGSRALASTLVAKKHNMVMHINWTIFFCIYVLLIINFTLFASTFGRTGLHFFNLNSTTLGAYMQTSFNIMPFRSITLYLNGIAQGTVTVTAFLVNIFGNLVAFMPFAFFIPLLFKPINKFWKFFICIALIVFCIELLQLLWLCGSCDIDDWILNVGGACLFYFFLKIPPICKAKNAIIYLKTYKQ